MRFERRSVHQENLCGGRETSWAVTCRGWKLEKVRVRTRITSSVWVLRHPSGKARGLRILLVWKERATLPDGMDRRQNWGSYFCASPKEARSEGESF